MISLSWDLERYVNKEHALIGKHLVLERWNEDLNLPRAAWEYVQELVRAEAQFTIVKVVNISEDGNTIVLRVKPTQKSVGAYMYATFGTDTFYVEYMYRHEWSDHWYMVESVDIMGEPL